MCQAGTRELTRALQLSQGEACHLSFLSCQGSEELGALGHQVGEPQIPMPQRIGWSWLGHLCAQQHTQYLLLLPWTQTTPLSILLLWVPQYEERGSDVIDLFFLIILPLAGPSGIHKFASQ